MFFKLKNSILICIACAGISTSTSAFAWEPYLNAELGFYNTNDDDYWLKNINNRQNFRLGFGYAKPLRKRFSMAIESGLNYYQADSYEEDSEYYKILNPQLHHKRFSIDLLAVIRFAMTSKFSFFFKVGPAYVIQRKFDHTCVSESCFIDWSSRVELKSYYWYTSTIAPKSILGFGYDITPKINLNLLASKEWQINRIGSSKTIALGINYRFC